MKSKILVIVGPNASGKSALAIHLAKGLAMSGVESEIVGADSRQVYRGLNIGSGKVTKREMQGVPHHMLDVADPKKVFSVSQYQKLAYRAIDAILSRGKLPIVVGGSGQYIDAITKGLVIPEVPPNPKLRAKLDKSRFDLSNRGLSTYTSELFKLLKALDPARAKQIDKHNPRRLIRAIEIAEALGKVPKLKSEPRYSPIIIGIKPTIHDLRFKIHDRLKSRMRAGMVGEVRELHKHGLSWRRLESLGLEYKYVALYLQGKLSRGGMLRKLETEIWRYAKRQMTWFKRDKKIIWLAPSEVEGYEKAGEVSLPRLRKLLSLRA
ncbi:MAG: tRNA (adenosine(37)-N6)-dimethylallyltransferase MiaA [Patescibacteria group bacterium]